MHISYACPLVSVEPDIYIDITDYIDADIVSLTNHRSRLIE
jgi:hypothetical protein